MSITYGYAAPRAGESLEPCQFHRRDLGVRDVLIEIHYCGVCRSDIDQSKGLWGRRIFPMVPGHEITGIVTSVGADVTKFRVGDRVGVGCFVDSCRECWSCKSDEEQHCEQGMVATYNGVDRITGQPTYGGYSTEIVVDEAYVLVIPESLPLDRAAPLLCAGITMYSALAHWVGGKGDRVGIVGVGGLGHLGVKIAKAMGAHVTAMSRTSAKAEDSLRLGADDFFPTSDAETFVRLQGKLDVLIITVSERLDWGAYLGLLKRGGVAVLTGIPHEPLSLNALSLIRGRKKLSGTLMGGIKETQEMLNFCAQHNIHSDIELIPIQKINEAFKRVVSGDVRYRFVIDIQSLKEASGEKKLWNLNL